MTFQPPRLGPGIIYLRSLDGLFRSHPDLIKVAEIEPQALWTKGTAPDSLPRGSPGELRHLQGLPQSFLTHGVGSPIGGTICDQHCQMPEFRTWTEAVNAPWTSEHLSIFHVRGARGAQPCGFLMPPLQTDAGVSIASENIRQRMAVLEKPFAFETGVNYFASKPFEMPDGEFFSEVAEAADCGILLDLTNLWANHKNGRAKISDVITRLPPERIWEVHLAGLQFAHGHWLDAHSNGIDDDLLEIAADVVADLPNLGAIIFEIAPDRLSAFDQKSVLLEIEKVCHLWERARMKPATTATKSQTFAQPPAPSPEEWEQLIAHRLLPREDQPTVNGDRPHPNESDERTFSLYLELAASFRRGAVAELMANTMKLLLLAMGEAKLRQLMDRYIAATPPAAFPTDEALRFRRFLEETPLSIPGLDDLSKFEATLIAAAVDGKPIQVEVSKDIDEMLSAIAIGKLPPPSAGHLRTVLEVAVDPLPSIRVLH
jgi:uncharacterized protein (UPF0276 family)